MVKLSSKPIVEHAEVPLADDGQWEAIVEHWQARGRPTAASGAEGNGSYVASVGPGRDPLVRAAQLAEIVSLVRSQGDRVVGQEVHPLTEPNPRTLLGKGAAEEMAARARAHGATMLVLDAELTPSQARNLEDAAGIPVADREAVILNVFLRHARTRRARIQVEVAQLEYLRPRIRGVGLDMDQQTGGMARARGPGETASELIARRDRRPDRGAEEGAPQAGRIGEDTARAARRVPADGARGLHERGQDLAHERADGRRPLGARRAVRDAGHDLSLPDAARRRRAHQQHRRLHPEAARPPARELLVDAGRDRRGVAPRLRGRRVRPRAGRAPRHDAGARRANRRGWRPALLRVQQARSPPVGAPRWRSSRAGATAIRGPR